MVFTAEALFEVAIEYWSEWDLNPRQLNSVQTNRLSYQAMSSTRTESQLCTATPILSFCSVSNFISTIAFVSRHVYFNGSFLEVIT